MSPDCPAFHIWQATEESKTSWSTERKEKREQFMAKVQRLMEASRNVRIAASNSKKELLLQRRADAKMIKMEATQVLIAAS